jgi:hypothetical protein
VLASVADLTVLRARTAFLGAPKLLARALDPAAAKYVDAAKNAAGRRRSPRRSIVAHDNATAGSFEERGSFLLGT